MLEALTKNEIDLIAPVYSDYWTAENQNISLSKSFATTNMTLLYEDNSLDKDDITSKIAITNTSPFQKNLLNIHIPKAVIVEYNTLEDMFRSC